MGDEDERHLAGALRLRQGEAVVASDGRGRWRPCRALLGGGRGGGNGQLRLEADGPVVVEPEPEPRVVVAFSLAKHDRNEWAVAKLVELGADEIVPMLCERTVVRDGGAQRHRRLERIAVQAAMQARRARLAALAPAEGFASVVDRFAGSAACLAEPGATPLDLSRPVVLVGPEGGWSERERELARAAGLVESGLGGNVLRVETAAVAAAALLCFRRLAR